MRTVGGEVTGLILTFNMSAALIATNPAINDIVALDTTANWTVTDSTNDACPLGRIVALDPSGTRCSVEIFRYRACVSLPTNAAIAVGSSIQTNGAGANNIEAAAAWNGTLVISDPGGAGNADVLV